MGSFDDFANDVERLVGEATRDGADVVQFPEYFTTGLLGATGQSLETRDGVATAFDVAGRKFLAPYRELFGSLAKQHSVHIQGGSIFYFNESENAFFNAGFFFQPDGTVTEQRKVHVTYELVYNRELASAGTGWDLIQTDLGTIGSTICYDVAFPEAVRMLILQGMDVLLSSVCVFDQFGVNRFRAYAASRALENQCYVSQCQVAGGYPDLPDPLHFEARSSIHAPIDTMMGIPDGVLADATGGGEQIVSADLDLEQLRMYRAEGVPAMLQDRRPEVYSGLHA